MGTIIALLIFGVIVTFHEFGHFIVAKKSGIKVIEFSVGMGPRIISWQGKETRYSLKIFPLGGSCMMLGEDEEEENLEGSFNSAPVLSRLATIFAGPFFNFILAFFFSLIIVANVGVDRANVTGVTDGYPAKEAGIKAGDVIKKLNGKNIIIYRDFLIGMYDNKDKPVTVTVQRNGEEIDFTITPKLNTENKRYMLGIENTSGNEKVGGFFEVIKYSIYEVWYNITSTVKSLGMMIRGRVSANDVSGPVGIVGVIGDTVNKTNGAWELFLTVANMIVLFSANLGVMNLLPIPALDGGRIVFLLCELVRGKPLNRKAEGYIHFAGFAFLMLLMVVVMFNDIRKLLGI
jgi:RIP metalloprotease rseP